MKIKAAVTRELGKFSFEEIELDSPKENEVLVEILSSGICRSDLTALKGVVPIPLPTVLGHEGVGIVREVGPGVTTHKVGDRVIMCLPSCGHCAHCEDGEPFVCDSNYDLIFGGVHSDGTMRSHEADGSGQISAFYAQGSFASHAVAQANCAIVVDVDDDQLRQLCSLGCGAMTGAGSVLKAVDPKPGSAIAIFGCGGVGMAAIMAAKIAGCSKIIAVDTVDSRLELCKELGATHTVNGKNVDSVEAVKEICDGRGANYSLECTGVPPVIKQAVSCLDKLGKCCLISVTGDAEVSFCLEFDFMNPNRTLRGASMGACNPRDFIPELAEHFKKGEFSIDKLVKHYKFEEIEQAIEDMKSGAVIKPILDMQ